MPIFPASSLDTEEGRAACVEALQRQRFVLIEAPDDSLASELQGLSDFFEHTPEEKKPKFNFLKCGYTKRYNADFLDLKSSEAGIRPKVKGFGNTSHSALQTLALSVLKGVDEKLGIARPEALWHSLDNDVLSEIGVDLEKFADDADFTLAPPAVSSSVLRCSRYRNRAAGGGGGESGEADSGLSFPPHTDSTFLTLSLARAGLEMLLFPEGDDGRYEWTGIEKMLNEAGVDTKTNSGKTIISLWVGDFLEILTGGMYKALPHRIDFSAGTTMEGEAPESHRHNITYLLRPDLRKTIDTLKYGSGSSADGSKAASLQIQVSVLRRLLDDMGRRRDWRDEADVRRVLKIGGEDPGDAAADEER